MTATAAVLAAGAVPAGATPPASTPVRATVSGPITVVGGSWFTVQTAGAKVGRIDALEAAATAVTQMNTPYVWGGGHVEAGIASSGERGGPGPNGRRRGFDCSGAVAAVLAGAGLWPAGAGVPADNGVISELLGEHLIARGVGPAPNAVTLYDDPGVHIFMNINGRFFGTSDGAGGGDRAGGPGWLADGAWDASSRAFHKYHFLPSVLDQATSYGSDYTFQLPAGGLFSATRGGGARGVSLGALGIADLLVGERVTVTYAPRPTGEMVVQSLAVLAGGPKLAPPTPTQAPPTPTPTSPTGSASTTALPAPVTGTGTSTTPVGPISASSSPVTQTVAGAGSGAPTQGTSTPTSSGLSPAASGWGYGPGGSQGDGGWSGTQAQAAIITGGAPVLAPAPANLTGGGHL